MTKNNAKAASLRNLRSTVTTGPPPLIIPFNDKASRRSSPMTETTGTDLVREAVRARKGNNAILARDIGITSMLSIFFPRATQICPWTSFSYLSRTSGTASSNFSQSRTY